MVQLPTLDVPATVATRVQNAFGSADDYRAWLRRAIRDEVLSREAAVIRAAMEAQMEAKVAQVDTDLTGL
jgi:hypothetical protein